MKIIRIVIIILAGIIIIQLGLRFNSYRILSPLTNIKHAPIPICQLYNIPADSLSNPVMPGSAKVTITSESFDSIVVRWLQQNNRKKEDAIVQELDNFRFATIAGADTDFGFVAVVPHHEERNKNIVYEYPSMKSFADMIHFQSDSAGLFDQYNIPYFPDAECEMFLQAMPNAYIVRLYSIYGSDTIVKFYNFEMMKKGWKQNVSDYQSYTKFFEQSGNVCMLDICENKKKTGTDIGIIFLLEN